MQFGSIFFLGSEAFCVAASSLLALQSGVFTAVIVGEETCWSAFRLCSAKAGPSFLCTVHFRRHFFSAL